MNVSAFATPFLDSMNVSAFATHGLSNFVHVSALGRREGGGIPQQEEGRRGKQERRMVGRPGGRMELG